MTSKDYEIHVGVMIDADSGLTLSQLCRLCAVHADYVVELVEEGVVQPAGDEITQWNFPGISIQRIRKARRLQTDLGINLAGVAVILELLDEVDYLRDRLKDIER